MDQQSIESLLRRLVERVEANERRYSEALDELHVRIDRLSQATEAVRAASSAEDAETFDRLHDQVSNLARRLEREASTPLDDFERLGRALSGDLDYAAGMMAKPDLLSELAASPSRASAPPFGERAADDHAAPPIAAPADDRDLDKRLTEMAHRLENSISTSMPTQAFEALQARLDEISEQIARAAEQAPEGAAIDALEAQISGLAQQLGSAQAQFARIGEIDAALRQLIERVDGGAGEMAAVASKAAEEAARRVVEDAKLNVGTAERLDAMHRDLMAMNERTRASDDRLAATIEQVHDSLKQLVQLIEQNPAQAQAPKPKPLPFADRLRELAPPPNATPEPPVNPPSAKAEAAVAERPARRDDAAGAAVRPKPPLPRNRLREAIAGLDKDEMAPNFGRAKRVPGGAKPVDLDQPEPQAKSEDAEYEAPDDLVAAARRAAQAAALKVEERGGGARLRRLPGDAEPASSGELPSRRKRPFLIICAAVLLAISALLLYSRLGSKPESEIVPPSVEQSAPLPEAPAEGGVSTPNSDEMGPAAAEPETPPAPPSGASEPPTEIEASPSVGERREPGNVTDIAKSAFRPASSSELMPQAQPAALKATETPPLPPGVVFSIEDPTLVPPKDAAPAASPIPQSLPLPPEEIGPPALRQAAAGGDPRAQHAIALRYAQGTPKDLEEAARWLERAAAAGLAPAQYRLGAMYERGQGVAKDIGRAWSWYQAAAEKGNVKAMHNLAVSLSGRETGNPDYALAAKWYAEAAAYGLADSQFNLGILTEHGLGMPKDPAQAYRWFALAAAAGDAEAAKRSELLKLRLDSAALTEAEQAVAAWTAKPTAPEANEVPELEEWADASPTTDTGLVSRAQTLLNQLGYDVGPADGLMGARTREAIKSFERKNGLEETGTVSALLVAKLQRLSS
ncbi:MAG TPA: peptidoglycan-binding protein [Methyloceanibacter sp.]|nr:peptidoglycan-binding protein [Methyloceanibacter sp.]